MCGSHTGSRPSSEEEWRARVQWNQREDSELARLRVENEELKRERDAAKEESKERGRTIKYLQDALCDRNRALDAMQWVWCSGGCKGGVHRWQEVPPAAEVVKEAVRNTGRLVAWMVNRFYHDSNHSATNAEIEAYRATLGLLPKQSACDLARREIVELESQLAAIYSTRCTITEIPAEQLPTPGQLRALAEKSGYVLQGNEHNTRTWIFHHERDMFPLVIPAVADHGAYGGRMAAALTQIAAVLDRNSYAVLADMREQPKEGDDQ